jgi:uncharacterized delta-60 repeat protein
MAVVPWRHSRKSPTIRSCFLPGERSGSRSVFRPRLVQLEDRTLPATWVPMPIPPDSVLPLIPPGAPIPPLQTAPTPYFLRGIWGNNGHDVFAVGEYRTILHYDGTAWTPQGVLDPTTNTISIQDPHVSLIGVWGVITNGQLDVFAVGTVITSAGFANGGEKIYHYSSAEAVWREMAAPLPTGGALDGLWGTTRNDVYAVGASGAVVHYDGTAWTTLPAHIPSGALYRIWGNPVTGDLVVAASVGAFHSADRGATWQAVNLVPNSVNITSGVWGTDSGDVFVAGAAQNPASSALVAHSSDSGATWTQVWTTPANSLPPAPSLLDIAGRNAQDVFAVGGSGVLNGVGFTTSTILHFDGVGWTAQASGTPNVLEGVWAGGPHTFVVGASGTILVSDNAPVPNVVLRDALGNIVPFVPEGTSFRLDARGTIDPDGVEDEARLNYSWRLTTPSGVVLTGSGPILERRFPESGIYTLTLTVTDPFGASAVLTQAFTVTNVAPAAAIGLGPALAPDPAFGTGGNVLTNASALPGQPSSVSTAATTALGDGRIVVLARVVSPSGAAGVRLFRYGANGVLDSGYSPGADLGAATPLSLAITPDGAAVVTAVDATGQLLVKRYLTNGSGDTAFNSNAAAALSGVQVSQSNYSSRRSLALQADGKILLAGGLHDGTTDVTLLRLNANGTRDASFGVNGSVITDLGNGNRSALCVATWDGGTPATPSDDQIVVAASGGVVARYDANGSLAGMGVTPGVTPVAILIRPAGQFVVVETAGPAGHFGTNVVLTQYTAAGSLDTAFGAGGVVMTPDFVPPIYAPWDLPSGLSAALQADGSIVVAGKLVDLGVLGNDHGSEWVNALARITPNGRLDPAFGPGGVLIMDPASVDRIGKSGLDVTAAPGCRIVCGETASGNLHLVQFAPTPRGAVVGQTLTFTLGATDLDPTDQAAGFTYQVTWGDGTADSVPRTPGNGTGVSLPHAYAAVGTYTIAVQATDKDGGVSPVFSYILPVAPATTATTLTSSVNPSAFGQSVTFTATVSAVAPGSGLPTGSVTFYDGASFVGTAALISGVATATFSTAGLTVGTHAITAAYGGDGNFNLSTSPSLTQVVYASGPVHTAITSNFNGTDILAGNTIWFNQVAAVSGIDRTNGTTIWYRNVSITFNAVTLTLPDTVLTYSPAATAATTVFDAAANAWRTTVPVSQAGNVFLSGYAYLVPQLINGGSVSSITWSGDFYSSTAGVSVNTKWASAVYNTIQYPNLFLDLNAIGVLAADGADHAGTPEGVVSGVVIKRQVIGGARGGGGSNYTGGYSGSVTVKF